MKFLTIFVIFVLVLAACSAQTPAEAPAAEAPAAEAPAAEAPAEEAPAAEAPAEEAPAAEAPAEEAPAEEAAAEEAAAEEAAAEAAPAEEAVDSLQLGELKDVPREDTLVAGWSISSPIGVTNPWALPGYTHQEANGMMWEGLSYFKIFADEEEPWLAESMEYNDDFTELTIKVNPLAKWSDGVPVTSKDVAFTFDGQLNIDTLPYHAAFVQFVDEIEVVDDLTVKLHFNQPAPRFKFEVLTLKFDTGIPIVPAHVLEPLGDAEAINAYQGGLEMPHSGPYTTVVWDATQKILDLREDWWAVEAGLNDLPDVKRIVMVNIGGQVGQSMEVVAQRVTNNEMDTALDFRQSIIASIIEQNPAVTSHTGDQPPYGYLDWWPNSLWVNTLEEPYSDARVRRAISLAINRDLIDEIVYEGAPITTIFPFPLYPGLQKFVDSDAVQALIEQYDPRKFDLEESAALMEEAGFTMNGDGLWEKDGETVNMTIHGFEGIHSDIVPVLVEMLLQAGFDASINFGTDAYQKMADGAPGAYMFGHGASLVDPYAALELFHGRFSESIGTSAGNNRFSRYSNPEYDAILDEMAPLGADDPRFQELAAQALEIYWKEQIDIPIIQWLHRIAYNQTNWTNWPTEDNLGPGVNGAFWAHTGQRVVTNLQKAE
jgi:ABC-type transport system substrate-binding protein